jgi:hypothetical protein
MASKIVAALLLFLGADRVAHSDSRFRAGQKWAYQTRHGEEGSTLTVLKVEPDPKLGEIVHIAIDGIKIKAPQGVRTHLEHTPISAKALEGSVTRVVVEKVPLPDFAEGYAQWKAARGGVFTIGVAKIVDAIEQSLASGAAR